MTTTEYLDRVGKPLEVGDTVVYPTYNDSTMVIATIEEFVNYEVTRHRHEYVDGRYQNLGSYQEPRWKVKLQPIPEQNPGRTWGRTPEGKYEKGVRKPKAVVVERVNNLVKVSLDG